MLADGDLASIGLTSLITGTRGFNEPYVRTGTETAAFDSQIQIAYGAGPALTVLIFKSARGQTRARNSVMASSSSTKTVDESLNHIENRASKGYEQLFSYLFG